MNERRTVLGMAGGALLIPCAGCLSAVLDTAVEAESIKGMMIVVDVNAEANSVDERGLLRLTSPRAGEIEGQVAEHHADLVTEDGTVSLPADRHQSFEDVYAGVRYVVECCGGDIESLDESGCLQANVPRDDFDELQFGDSITIELEEGQYYTEATINEIKAGSTEDWTVDIETIEFPDEAE